MITVQLCDNLSRLVLIKTPRSIAAKIRAILSCSTSLPAANNPEENVPVTLTVIGEHGSLRTAKRSMITKLRGAYRERIQDGQSTLVDGTSNEKIQRIGQSLQTILQELHAIDF